MLAFLHRGAGKWQWIPVGDVGRWCDPHMTVPMPESLVPLMITEQVFQHPGCKPPQLEGENIPLKEVSTLDSANLVSEVRCAPRRAGVLGFPPYSSCCSHVLISETRQ